MDKTLIGRIEKGFDFLGYHFSPEGLSMAEKTIEKFLARAVRFYEQEQEEPFGSPRPAWIVRAAVGQVGKCRPKKYKSDCEMGNTTKMW